jgi:hypothetical protein
VSELFEAGGEGFAEVVGEGAEGGEGFGGGGFEDALHFGGYFCALRVAVHAEGAGEFMGYAEGFEAGGFVEGAGGRGGAELVEEVEALSDRGEILLPELSEEVVDLVWLGFFHGIGRSWSEIKVGVHYRSQRTRTKYRDPSLRSG